MRQLFLMLGDNPIFYRRLRSSLRGWRWGIPLTLVVATLLLSYRTSSVFLGESFQEDFRAMLCGLWLFIIPAFATLMVSFSSFRYLQGSRERKELLELALTRVNAKSYLLGNVLSSTVEVLVPTFSLGILFCFYGLGVDLFAVGFFYLAFLLPLFSCFGLWLATTRTSSTGGVLVSWASFIIVYHVLMSTLSLCLVFMGMFFNDLLNVSIMALIPESALSATSLFSPFFIASMSDSGDITLQLVDFLSTTFFWSLPVIGFTYLLYRQGRKGLVKLPIY